MDIQHLVDRLEDLIDEGRHIFGTKYTMIDEERALELIDQMRISIPEEIEKSTRVMAHRDRILEEANEEASRVLTNARQKQEEFVGQDAGVQVAKTRAEHIIAEANKEAMRITAEADEYVKQSLVQLEQRLTQNLNQIRNGITMLQNQPATPAKENKEPQLNETEQQELETVANFEYEQVEVDRK